MKTFIKIACVLFFFCINDMSAQNSKDYYLRHIAEILDEAYGSIIYFDDESIQKLEKIELKSGKTIGFSYGNLNGTLYGYRYVPQVAGKGCKLIRLYEHLKFKTINSFSDISNIRKDSPIKILIINFKENDVTATKGGNCGSNYEDELINEIRIPYLNKGDNRNKLIEYFTKVKEEEVIEEKRLDRAIEEYMMGY